MKGEVMDWDERIGRRITLRDVRILLTAVEVGSVSKAAIHLRVSQPAISKTITQVERAVGAQLVKRSSRGIEPTDEGKALLVRSRAALHALQAGLEAINDRSYPTSGEVQIAGNQVALSGIIPIVINRIYRREPGLIFNVMSVQPFADQVRLLEEQKAELVLGRITQPLNADHLRVVELFRDDLLVVIGPRNRWSGRKKIDLAELMKEPWALPPPETSTGQYVMEIFRASGLDLPQINVMASSMQLHQRLVLESDFLTLFPKSLAKSIPGMHVLPVTLKSKPRFIGILTLKNRTLSALATLFIDEAQTVIRDGHSDPLLL